MITFSNPWVLAGLVLCVLPWVIRPAQPTSAHPSLMRLPPDRLSRYLLYLQKALLSLVAFALVTGLAGPRLQVRAYERWEKAAAVVFVLDASGSMTVSGSYYRLDGFVPKASRRSRLELALLALQKLVASRPKDALGLIVFGDGPLTYAAVDTDHRRLLQVLSLPYTNMGGTVIDLALVRALQALEGIAQPGSRAVVLLSDGEGRIQAADSIADAFLRTGTRFFWIQVGLDAYTDPHPTREFVRKLGSYARVFELRDEATDMETALQAVAELVHGPVRLRYHRDAVALAHWAWALGAAACAGLVGFIQAVRWP